MNSDPKQKLLQDQPDKNDGGLTFGELTRTIAAYKQPILISVVALMLVWAAAASLFFLASPSRRFASLPFRLEFKGAEQGQYPNGTRFQSTEILSTPVLSSVYRTNGISPSMDFEQFRASFFILETNEALDQLAREYRARLSDPKLSPVDRERLEQEFAEKRASLSQANYSIVFSSPESSAGLPRTLQAKILNDVLATWAEQTIQNKGVVLYDLSILSSAVFERSMLESYDYVITLDMLRSKINRVVSNVNELLLIPGAKVVRTGGRAGVSLAEIKVRLEDMLGFRIQPLVGLVLAKGISKDPTASIEFLETRLKFNEIQRNEEQRRTEAIREALRIYVQEGSRAGAAEAGYPSDGSPGSQSTGTVIPQIGESFLEKIMQMSSESGDLEYRQRMVDQLRQQSLTSVPLESEAEYYRQLLDSLRGFESRARPPQDDEIQLIRAQIDSIVNGAIAATDQVNQIYSEISKNLNPSTVLYSSAGPTAFTIERSVPLWRVLLSGLLVFLLSVPLAVGGSLIHARRSGNEPVADESPRRTSFAEPEAIPDESLTAGVGNPAPGFKAD